MALNDTATLVINSGNFFTGPVGADAPADLSQVDLVVWTNMGNTSVEDILGWESEGGEPTILKTLQNKSIRTTRTNVTETLSVVLQQFDADSMRLFFGSTSSDGAAVGGGSTANWLQIKSNPVPTVCSFLAVFVDGTNLFGIHIPKCEIFRGDSLSLNNTEDLASLPISITPLQLGSNDWTVEVTPLVGSPVAEPTA